jgi:hypothetical protein
MNSLSAEDVVLINVSSTDQALTKEACQIRVAGAGNVALITRAGSSVVMAFLAGEAREVYTSKILHTGTTATGVEAMISPFANENKTVATDADPTGVSVVTGTPST